VKKRVDRETRELLGADEELLATARAVAKTQDARDFGDVPGARSRLRHAPVLVLVAALAVAAVLGATSSLSTRAHHDGLGSAVGLASGRVTHDPDASSFAPAGPNEDWLNQIGDGVTSDVLTHAGLQAAAISVGDQTPWTVTGPSNIGGRVTDLVVDPTNPKTIYVAAAGGGVWKSTDEGSTFTSVWPSSNTQTIGALAMGPDGTLWAGTGEANPAGGGMTFFGNGVYKSTNGGATWTNVGLQQSDAIGRIVVDPSNANQVWVAASGSIYASSAQRGIYHSVDGGATWTLALGPPNATTGGVDIALDPANSNRVYAALWDHHRDPCCRTYGGVGSGLFRSDDDGATWTRLQNVTGALPSYDTAQTGLTSDASLGRIGIAIAPSDPNRVYVIAGTQFGGDKGFFVSNDGGDSFTAAGRAGGNSGYSWWFGRVWVDPGNENHLFAADVNLRQSTNGGTTWAALSTPHADQHAMAWDLSTINSTDQSAERVYLGNDGGIYHSDTDGTANAGWIHAINEPWNQAYHIAVAADNNNRIATGLQDNGSNRTWTPANPSPTDVSQFNSYGGGDGHYVAIDPSNDKIYYQCSQNASCGGIQDNATGQTTLRFGSKVGSTRFTTDAPLVLDPSNPAVVYVGGNVLDRSLNHGSTFTQMSPSDPNDLPGLPSESENDPTYANTYATITAIAPGAQNPNPGTGSGSYASTVYVGTDTGLVWKTTDAGVTWTQLTNGLPTLWVNSIAVDPSDNDHAIVAFSGFRVGDDTSHLYETTDGGSTWTSISGNLPNAPVEDVALDDADNLIVAATDLGVYYLRDPADLPLAPTSWHGLGTLLPQTPDMDLKIDGTGTNLFVGTFGRGIYYLPLPKDTTAPTTTASLSPSPVNGWYPANPTVTLSALDDANGSGVEETDYQLDGGPTQAYSAPFTVTGDGTHTLLFWSIDSAGNTEATNTLSFQVDTTAPVVTPPANVTVEAAGASGSVVNYPNATAVDVQDGPVAASCTPASGSLFPRGHTSVLCSATDQAGNIGTGSFDVFVQHTNLPVVTVPSSMVVEATGPGGATVTYPPATAVDTVDGPLTATCSPASGSTFPIGHNTVTCSATDSDHLTGQSTFDIDVVDTTPPTLHLPSGVTGEATGPAGAVVSYAATATDLVDGTDTPSCVPASGSTFPLGHTTVHCTVSDAHSNANQGQFDVDVVDTTSPVVTVPGNGTVEASGPTGATVPFTATANDAVSGSLTPTCTPASGSTFPLGSTQVVCAATDAASNTGSAFFTITVVDTTPPVIQPHTNVVAAATTPSGAAVTFSVSSVDLVDGTQPASCSPAPGSVFPLGHTTVTCTAVDAHHNAATPTTFDVDVENASMQVADLSTLIAGMGLDKGLANDLQNRLDDIARKIGQPGPPRGGTSPACGPLDDLVQRVVSAYARPPHGPTLAQAQAIVAAADTIEGALGCISPSSAIPAVEQDLLAFVGTVNGLGLSTGITNDLDNRAADVSGKLADPAPPAPPHGPAPASASCRTLDDLAGQIASQTGKKNGLTSGQAATLGAAVAHISSELVC
jgi:photosystem II stability/assembly factor-like uncharacterized protein